MIGKKRYGLIRIIGNDLLRYYKLKLLLLIAILASAIIVVAITYKTRRLTAEREQMFLRRNMLDIEWRNLILEENTLSNQSRIERIATEKLQMQHVDSSQENIVIKP